MKNFLSGFIDLKRFAVCLAKDDYRSQETARKLALEIGWPLIGIENLTAYDAVLMVSKHGLSLKTPLLKGESLKRFSVLSGWQTLDFSSRAGKRSDQPFLKSIRGSKRPLGPGSIVLDGTAGLGHDSWLLAAFGFHVLAVEKHPVVYVLLREALSISGVEHQQIARRIRIENANTMDILAALIQRKQNLRFQKTFLWEFLPDPDVIYLDPLFPKEVHKKRAVKKTMRFVRTLLNDEAMDLSLLENSLQVARKRVVLKRPVKSETLCLGKKQPVYQTRGKVVRYDVYMP